MEVNFAQQLYSVGEGDGSVVIAIRLSQVSSEPFDVMINAVDGTAAGEDHCTTK